MQQLDEHAPMTIHDPPTIKPASVASAPPAAVIPHIRIQASKGWVALKLRELWEYRELLYFLTWRDIKVRYKQTILGASWAILQPVLLMVVFTFVGGLARLGTGGVPRPVFTF